MQRDALSTDFPLVKGHPNRLPFEGILTRVDTVSDKAPGGARGHKVVLTKDAATEALPSLLGMAVDFKADWDGHDARRKCGIITSAEIHENVVHVRGYLFAHDFPEVEQMLCERDEEIGMSYELANAHVEDMRASIWRLTKATFTGAAILRKDRAAYQSTSFRVVQSHDRCRKVNKKKLGEKNVKPLSSTHQRAMAR